MPTNEQLATLRKFIGAPVDDDLVRDELLHEMFEKTVDKFHDKNAIETPTLSLTYRQLDERANRFARHLRSLDIGPEDRVAFQLPRGELVYIVMLGVLKAGAAYVPLDPSYPADRVAFILDDCSAKLFVTTETIVESMRAELESRSAPILAIDPSTDFALPSGRISREETGAKRESLAYMIYTSGTTGRPKGCLVEHHNICEEIRSAAKVYGVTEADRVFQGFSVAFDASLEEIWLAFFNGCELIVGTKEMMQSGARLSDALMEARVTVLSCVPTLLSMVEDDIPTLRIIIVGGEACPKDLAARWHRQGRRLFNSYGPTEATVIATCAELEPNEPVTIGYPIPNYRVYIVGDNLEILPPGDTGELCIGGAGVTRGYLNRDDLTREKFVEIATLVAGRTERVYRTGDLARFDASGQIEFLGRADDQIKLRGFRIELSEIESVLLRCPGVLSAAVAFNEELQQLAAYVVMRDGDKPNRKVVIAMLRECLPAYMIPAWLDVVDTLPMLVSGKVNRKLLPRPASPLVDDERIIIQPRNKAEERLHALWADLFNRKDISVLDDFFLDLGGHSLLAAALVSHLRLPGGRDDISMTDLYQNPTIEAMAQRFAWVGEDAASSGTAAGETPASTFHRPDKRSHLRCAIWQAVLLPVIFSVYAWMGLGPFLLFDIFLEEEMQFAVAAVVALGVFAASIPFLLILPLVAKWLLLGRIRPGRHPLWGGYYIRFWFVRALLRAAPLSNMAGTPAVNVFYRLMGAKIGKSVYLGGAPVFTFDLLEIGDGASVGAESSVDGYWIEDGMMCLNGVSIGAGCVIGNRSVVSPGSSMADRSSLGDLSLLDGDRRIPEGEAWAGSPARPAGKAEREEDAPDCWGVKNTPLLLVGTLLLPLFGELPIFPGLFVAAYFNWYDAWHEFLVATPFIAFTFVLIVCALAALIKRMFVPRLEEGTYRVNSMLYVRHWFFSAIYRECLHIVGTVFSTLYLRYWFRLLGAKLGDGAEVSTATGVQPNLLDIGDGSFVADDVMIGAPRFANGRFTVGRVHIGSRTFLGNSSVIPAGSVIGSDSLIGCLSTPPGEGRATGGTSWFGSPPIFLPNRQKVGGYDESVTFRPSVWMRVQRFCIEAFRILLPNLLFVGMAMAFLDSMIDLWNIHPWLVPVLLPFGYFGMAVLAFVVLLAIKWLLMGRYRPSTHPLWSRHVWLTEVITGAYENFGARFLFDPLKCTPFLAWPLRLLGMRIGRRCYIDSTWFTEMDLIDVGDDTALNEDANLQTHLFEDRVMKEGRVSVGDRSTIGAKAFILYDTRIGDEVFLDDLSIVMKGESLPDRTRWHGIPCRRIMVE